MRDKDREFICFFQVGGYSFCLIDDAGRLSQYAAERRMAQPTFSLLNKIMFYRQESGNRFLLFASGLEQACSTDTEQLGIGTRYL